MPVQKCGELIDARSHPQSSLSTRKRMMKRIATARSNVEHITAGVVMKMSVALLVLGSALGASGASAQDSPLTAEEFQSMIVGKSMLWKLDDGKTYEMELAQGGKATISGSYNDVGKWRGDGPNGYCTSWNKRPLNEACVKVVKREGVLTALRPDGTFRGAQAATK